MTAKQKANRERFKKVVAEAKKLRAKNKKLTQAQAVKQAWAIMYNKTGTKKVGAPAKKSVTRTKVKAKKSKKTGEMHTDTKSHNVNIKVVSGLKKIIGIPHKGKYYITYNKDNYKKVEYFDKLPKDKYKGSDRIIYVTRLTDNGTNLIPLKSCKTDKFLKK